MLPSFNKCSFSALTAPIYQSVRRIAVGKNSKIKPLLRSQLQCVSFIGLYVNDYHVIVST